MWKQAKYDYYKIKEEMRKREISKCGESNSYFSGKRYAKRLVLNITETSAFLYDKLSREEPFFVGRLGASETFCCNVFEFDLKKKKKEAIEQLCMWSGFFPEQEKYAEMFYELMVHASGNIDMLGIWNLPSEEYYIKKYMQDTTKLTYITSLQPWRAEKPWTKALETKKILVVSPFEKTIMRQYKHRELLFKEKEDVLPLFELKTLKAVQTIAGIKDTRFTTWFDALEYMKEEIDKIEYDIAILGCGAYGYPLASWIKSRGKQAIHLGGVTQLLFGIRGKRWDNERNIMHFYNEYWTRPDQEDTPLNKEIVENGCYW